MRPVLLVLGRRVPLRGQADTTAVTGAWRAGPAGDVREGALGAPEPGSRGGDHPAHRAGHSTTQVKSSTRCASRAGRAYSRSETAATTADRGTTDMKGYGPPTHSSRPGSPASRRSCACPRPPTRPASTWRSSGCRSTRAPRFRVGARFGPRAVREGSLALRPAYNPSQRVAGLRPPLGRRRRRRARRAGRHAAVARRHAGGARRPGTAPA